MLLVEKLLGSSSIFEPSFVEDVFSTQLYTGTSATRIIPTVAGFASGATQSGWVASLGVAIDDNLNQVATAVDSVGNLYVCSNYAPLGTSPQTIMLTKYDPAGTVLWTRARQLAELGVARDIALDAAGANVYIVGSVNASRDPDPLDPAGFVIKFDSSGTVQWERRIAYITDTNLYGVAVDLNGNVIICGESSTGAGASNRPILLKLTSAGNLTWAVELAIVSNHRLNSVAVDSSGDIYAVGSISDGASAALRAFKFTSNGVMQWQNTRTSPNLTGTDVALDSSGNVYALGRISTSGFNSLILTKYDNSGNLLFGRQASSPVAFSGGLAVDSNSNPYIIGTNRIGTLNAAYVAKYNTSGTAQWERNFTLGTATANNVSGVDIATDANNNVYMISDQGAAGSGALVAKLPADGSGLAIYTTGRGPVAYVSASMTQTSAALSVASSGFGTVSAAVANTSVAYTSVNITTSAAVVSAAQTTATDGLVWIKSRSATFDHALYDTVRGATRELASNVSTGQTIETQGVQQFLNNGIVIGNLAKLNLQNSSFVSWNFREQPRFFDVVPYTGNGTNRAIAHNLQSEPGCIIVKRLSSIGDWQVYHRSLGSTQYTALNSAAPAATGATLWNNTAPTASVFSLGTDATVNANLNTYVAYLFAHNAGGFGSLNIDNVISCGSYTGNGLVNGPVVTLGWEPQWLLIKRTDELGDWNLIDNLRGFRVGGADSELNPNLTNAESTGTFVTPTATGFQLNTTDSGYNAGGTYIYIAIRRGPMRTPTTGASVFAPIQRTGTGANATVTGGPLSDAVLIKNVFTSANSLFSSRLTGGGYLLTPTVSAEVPLDITVLPANPWDVMDGVKVGTTSPITNELSNTFINYLFRRAPGFFDITCYTGTGSATTVSHNLGVAPELMIVKNRSDVTGRAWAVYAGNPANYLVLNTTAATVGDVTYWNATAPTASVFTVGTNNSTNEASDTFIAYLFASVPGVSKIGTYTGTVARQVIDCGFAAGARFILIKRTDAVGDWHVWDSTRGIVAANDPYWRPNSPLAQVSNTDWVDPAANGFELSNVAGNLVNSSGASYIFFAIA